MQHTRWCKSMAGEEFARMYSWGHNPYRKVSVEDSSIYMEEMLGREGRPHQVD